MTDRADNLIREAEAHFRALLARDPRDPGALLGLADLAFAVGRLDVAATLVLHAGGRGGPVSALWRELGAARFTAGDRAAAGRMFAVSAMLDPADAETLYDLGVVRRDGGDEEGAIGWLRRAASAGPMHRHAGSDLADLLGRRGRHRAAEAALRRLLASMPAFDAGWYNYGVLIGNLGRVAASRQAYIRAAAISPGMAAAHYNAGCAAAEQWLHGAAAGHFRRALAVMPAHAPAWNNLGVARREQGRPEAALTAFHHAHHLDPAYHEAVSNLLLTLATVDGQAADAVARAWGSQFPARPRPVARPVARRRLRIGYLSADLRRHSCAFFLEPLFAAHDRRAVEVFAYADIAMPDAVSARLRAAVDHWRQVGALDDETLAATIAADGIDVLVDLAGHTARNRLRLFARRVAPVQVSWLGYNATTGLSQIDWRLVDDRIRPLAGREWLSEEPWSLGATAHCWRPPSDAPEPLDRAPDPRAIVFGSFNALHKLGPATLAVWSRILLRVPGSRLFLKGGAGDDPGARARLLGAMAGHGIDPGRVEIAGWRADARSHLALYGKIDIALDPFPYNGTTTTCEALWMGVPVVTLIGDRLLSRIGYGLVDAVGLAELAAATEDDYVDRAVVLSRAPDRLRALRRGLRGRMAASPLRDEAGFARAVETAFMAMMGEPGRS